jgi:hypothetical protein
MRKWELLTIYRPKYSFLQQLIAKMGVNDHIQAKILFFATIAKRGLIDL